MKLSRHLPRVIEHIKTAFWATLGYAIIWSVVFAVCFLINKVVGDHATATILQLVKYAGYPLLGIGWVIGMIAVGAGYVISKIIVGVILLLKFTFPYCLYVIGIPLGGWLLVTIFKALIAPSVVSRAELEAEQRHQESMRVVRGAMMLRTLSDLTKK